VVHGILEICDSELAFIGHAAGSVNAALSGLQGRQGQRAQQRQQTGADHRLDGRESQTASDESKSLFVDCVHEINKQRSTD
jgi:hypothetical protein